jgi:hypothetical protein
VIEQRGFTSLRFTNRAIDEAMVCLQVGIDTLHQAAKIAV